MRTLVTGTAGFIGSHLAEALIDEGCSVVGIDRFLETYDPEIKWRNIEHLNARPGFELIEADLREVDLEHLLEGIQAVFHHAAVPGVRTSWSSRFEDYTAHNVIATHQLLEAARHVELERFIFASSSSVYGNALRYPTTESDVPRPYSPYGVTKLAGEHLSLAYAGNFGVPVTVLRYFSVYGPRQRPDMGIHRIIEAALGGSTFSIFGTGAQVRDVTYVGDVVAANLSALSTDTEPGLVINIAGGADVTINEVVAQVGEIVGNEVPVQRAAERPGDVYRTGGATELAHEMLSWKPTTGFDAGLKAQIAWHRDVPGGR